MSSQAAPLEARNIQLDLFAPLLFVLLWSTGFVGAKLGLPYAEPFTFLLIRFALAGSLLAAITLAMRAPWPQSRSAVAHSAVVGLMLQGAYLGGVFNAIHAGMSAGLAALIVGMQPLLTSILGQAILGERVVPRQWLGLALGFVGVVLVVGAPLLTGAAGNGLVTPFALGAVLLALLGGTLGTLYQRHFCRDVPLLGGTTVQSLAAGTIMLPAALLTETMEVQWTPPFIFAMVWLIVVLSLGATLLLMALIRRTSAARVASLFYLVPPATAIEAYFLFGERLDALALIGMAVAVCGVALVLRRT